ncbi:MAG TPA: carbohydrate-binding module family 20 domain-containing protein [Tepidisphaeraceae bacterium]|nr:carbohydrate-binding module family 20 domain-containing protein [Tepidisphaeraceae bacterium]
MTPGTGELIVFKCTSFDRLPVLLLGGPAELGAWHAEKAVPMQPSGSGPKLEWSASVMMPLGQTFEFKFIKRGETGIIWESGSNRRFTVISGHHTLSDSFRT